MINRFLPAILSLGDSHTYKKTTILIITKDGVIIEFVGNISQVNRFISNIGLQPSFILNIIEINNTTGKISQMPSFVGNIEQDSEFTGKI